MTRVLHLASLAVAATAATGWALTARHARRLAALARIDPLTGTLLRGPFTAAAEEWLHRPGGDVVLLVADVDNLKPTNDTWGHAAGDLVLAATGRRLMAPVSGRVPLVGRIGGDEFAVLYRNPDPRDLHGLADRLGEPVPRLGKPDLPVSVSLGSTSCDRRETCTLAGALAVADAAMYQVKHHRRTAAS